uniref:Vomeronasal 2, receptor27 n=1 Tax=Mus musculus TaxID=10090 RepID=A0A3B2WB88_MOUSE
MKLLIAFSLVIVLISFQEKMSCFYISVPDSPGYNQDGDFLIGGFFSLRVTGREDRTEFCFNETMNMTYGSYFNLPKHYQHILAMVFAVETINKDPNILFNMSLGFYLFDVDFIVMKAMESCMVLISGERPPIPNYSCRPEKTNKPVAVIGGYSKAITAQISQVLSLYNVPQISYAPFDQSLASRVQLQSPYQFPVHTAALYQGIIQLMLYFTWVWVGLVVPDDMRGELYITELTEDMTKHGLCIAFAVRSPIFPCRNTVNLIILEEELGSLDVVLVYGDSYDFFWIVLYIPFLPFNGNVLITNSDWYTTFPYFHNQVYEYFGGVLLFSDHMDEILGFKEFLRNLQPRKYPQNIFIQDMWSIVFECPHLYLHKVRELSQCEPNGSLSTRPLHVWDMNTSPMSYKVHAAVYAIAQALHVELSVRVEGDSFDKGVLRAPLPWKLHPFLQNGQFVRLSNEENIVNKEGSATKLDIFNYQSLQSGTEGHVKVGEFVFEPHRVQHLSLNEELIRWGEYHNMSALHVCSQTCPLGFSKIPDDWRPLCCYDCAPCPDGEFANETDHEKSKLKLELTTLRGTTAQPWSKTSSENTEVDDHSQLLDGSHSP